MISHFVDFRKEVVTRRSTFELNKAEDRLHILEGLKIALDNIDRVVAIIRQSKNTEEARNGLMARFPSRKSRPRASSTCALPVSPSWNGPRSSTSLSRARKRSSGSRPSSRTRRLLMEVIKKELVEIRDKYGDDRLTEIVDELPEITVEDMIKEEEVVVTITYGGYIKRTPLDLYKQQLRGGKGKIGIVVSGKTISSTSSTSPRPTRILSSLRPPAGRISGRSILSPEAHLSAKGKPVINLIKAEKDEKITAVTHVKDFPEDKYLFLATRKGQVKKMSLALLKNVRQPGIKAIELPEDDSLMDVLPLDPGSDVVLGTKKGMAIRFREEDMRSDGQDSLRRERHPAAERATSLSPSTW